MQKIKTQNKRFLTYNYQNYFLNKLQPRMFQPLHWNIQKQPFLLENSILLHKKKFNLIELNPTKVLFIRNRYMHPNAKSFIHRIKRIYGPRLLFQGQFNFTNLFLQLIQSYIRKRRRRRRYFIMHILKKYQTTDILLLFLGKIYKTPISCLLTPSIPPKRKFSKKRLRKQQKFLTKYFTSSFLFRPFIFKYSKYQKINQSPSHSSIKKYIFSRTAFVLDLYKARRYLRLKKRFFIKNKKKHYATI